MHVLGSMAAVLLATTLSSQDFVRPVPFDPSEKGIVERGPPGKVEVLEIGDQRIVFSRAVRGWEIGELPGGRWVILAGGVDPGLDIYVFDPQRGEVIGLPFHVTNGLRLSPTFANGAGAWPLFEVPHLFVLAVERRGRISCIAVDASRQVPRELASLDLPLSVSDFRVSFDATTEQVRVEFDGADAVLEFAHPLAPRLVVEPHHVSLGDLAPGEVRQVGFRLRNVGRRPLRIQPRVSGAGLSIDRSDPIDIEAGGENGLMLTVRAPERGRVRGMVGVDSAVIGASVSIAVRGRVQVTARTEPTSPEIAGDRPDDATVPDELESVPDPAPDATLEPFRRRELRGIAWWRLDADRVWVDATAALESRGSDRARLVVRNRFTGGEVVAPRAGRACVVDARAGDSLSVGVIDGTKESPFVTLCEVRPELRVEDGVCVVESAPNVPFFLLLVEPAADGQPKRVLRSWRGVAGADGSARFSVAGLRHGTRRLHLVAAEAAGEPGRLTHSPIVVVE